jgi:hypothetical protein
MKTENYLDKRTGETVTLYGKDDADLYFKEQMLDPGFRKAWDEAVAEEESRAVRRARKGTSHNATRSTL